MATACVYRMHSLNTFQGTHLLIDSSIHEPFMEFEYCMLLADIAIATVQASTILVEDKQFLIKNHVQ